MNRFFRSAFFPLVVIVIVAWLAFKVLHTGPSATKTTYSELIQQVKQGEVKSALFKPNSNQIDATLTSGQKISVNYPTDQSATEFQNLLTAHNVAFDSSGIGSSPWWGLLTGMLP